MLVVTPERAGNDASASWRRIRDAVESAEWVAPVVVDRDGRSSYPTGTLGVRFAAQPSDPELTRFAAKHGVRLLSRNEYVPEQMVFAPEEPRATFLPDLVTRLHEDENVQAAWPVTVAQYDRVDRG